ncbi:Hypothetical protein CINCED_3A012958 [Cinara cedri]|uniref:Uncharacterized protein n=1 Tax=Cinara cedri TaxID=506608 RepID=A0A5E4NQ33_9HEMI|nr:Hypothetical protein CINCED_3A012958 [Cinara cedri]
MAYRTVSYEAATLLSSMIPIELSALEYEKIQNITNAGEKADIRRQTTQDWQTMCDSVSNARWTHRLLLDVTNWIYKKHGMLNYHIIQVLTEHGNYLHKFRITETQKYIICENPKDNAEHTIFECDAWTAKKRKLYEGLGENRLPDNICRRMLSDKKSWELISDYMEHVMRTQINEEQKLQ